MQHVAALHTQWGRPQAAIVRDCLDGLAKQTFEERFEPMRAQRENEFHLAFAEGFKVGEVTAGDGFTAAEALLRSIEAQYPHFTTLVRGTTQQPVDFLPGMKASPALAVLYSNIDDWVYLAQTSLLALNIPLRIGILTESGTRVLNWLPFVICRSECTDPIVWIAKKNSEDFDHFD